MGQTTRTDGKEGAGRRKRLEAVDDLTDEEWREEGEDIRHHDNDWKWHI